MVCFLVPVQQAIGDHSDEERKIQSDDDNADNLHDEVARASEWATRFHDQGATAKELLTSMSLVWKYVQKVVVVSSFDVNWLGASNGESGRAWLGSRALRFVARIWDALVVFV